MSADDEDDYMGDLSQFLGVDEVAKIQSLWKMCQTTQLQKLVYQQLYHLRWICDMFLMRVQKKTPEPLTTTHEKKNKKPNWREKQKMKKEERQKKEDEVVKQGVNSAIPSSNIGFKLLQQMGYKQGAALGKHGQGSLEPVGVEIKRSRTGLGRDAIIEEEKIGKEREMEAFIRRRRLKEKELMLEFEERKKMSWQSKKIMANYRKAYAVLAQLCGVDSIPSKLDEKDENEKGDNESEEDVEITAEDLREALLRLRSEFSYCLFCGCQYESSEALFSCCPGLEEDDH